MGRRLRYEGPVTVWLEEGVYPSIALGSPIEGGTWYDGPELGSELYRLIGQEPDEGGWMPERTFSARVMVELLEEA